MKNIIALLFTFAFLSLHAQTSLIPGDTIFAAKYIKPETYQMKWSIVQAGQSHQVALINTSIQPGKKRITIVSDIKVNNAKTTWIDSTITNKVNFLPVRHYSDNLERVVKLKFGASVTGSYIDKAKNLKTNINDVIPQGNYFDSNFYPYLVRLLPLKEGYTCDVATYDYSPAKRGIITQKVTDVKTGTYKDKKGQNEVWIVTSKETIKGQTTEVKYYIAKSDRKLFKQEIFDGMMHTLIERSE
ncbi:hypothetical protein ACX0HA_10255 [Flavobacterium hauense]